MKKLLLVSCVVLVFPFVASASDSQEFAEALGWEQKWQKVTSRSMEKYLSKIESGPFAKLSAANKKAAVSELRHSLTASLSWNVMGQDFSQGIIKHCDADTLKAMTKLYNRESVPNVDKKVVAKEYSRCAKKGFSESMIMLRNVIVNSRGEVEDIMNRYK